MSPSSADDVRLLERAHLNAGLVGATGLILVLASVTVGPDPDAAWFESARAALGNASALCVASLPVIWWRRLRRKRWTMRSEAGGTIGLHASNLVRARRFARAAVAAGILLVFTTLLVNEQVSNDYEQLALVADRVEGRVVELQSGRGARLTVAFSYEAVGRETTVNEFDSRNFEVGGTATVLVNPDDPSEVTVEGVERATGIQQVIEVVSLFGFLLLIPYGLVACRRVSLLGDAVLATGWRRAEVSTRLVRRTTRIVVDDRHHFTLITVPFGLLGREPEGRTWVAGPESGPLMVRDDRGIVGIGRRSPFLRD